MNPHEYLILCTTGDTDKYITYGRTIGISPFPSLNNTGDSLVLKNENDSVIFEVQYSDKWYKSDHKKSGGWSLEMIDPFTLCQNATNWSASQNSSGGTPGKINSVYKPYTDTVLLTIDTITINRTLIKLWFNKSLEETSAKNISFKVYDSTGTEINYILKIANVDSPYYRFFEIYLQEIFEPGGYTIKTNPLSSCNSNASSVSVVFIVEPKPTIHYPLLINEIFADPSPTIRLPEAEFIELYNYSDSVISLNDMVYSDPSTLYQFKNDSILPLEYLIITSKDDSVEYAKYGRIIAIDPFPSLNNSFDILTLYDPEGTMIDQVSYSDQWYKDPEKKQGGWALELIDPDSHCDGLLNWIASEDSSGGTPGQKNSIYKTITDTTEFRINKIEVLDSVTLQLYFSTAPDLSTTIIVDNYFISPSIGNPLAVHAEAPEYHTIVITLSSELIRGKLYTITVNNFQKCNGDLLSECNMDFIFPIPVVQKDVLINEVLFNPKPDGIDYVEVYNNSGHIIDLSKLYIANTKNEDSLNVIRKISDEQKLLFPEKYLLISSNTSVVQQQYFTRDPGAFIQISSMPSYNDDDGSIVLLTEDSSRIDQFDYHEDMHFALLEDPEGYSLERKNFSTSAQSPGNWASASSTSGGGTPGYKNSQADDSLNPESKDVIVTPEIFSPDNDGHDDYLHIYYHFPKRELKGSISVFDYEGALIRKLVKGELLGLSGEYVWDGLDDNQQRSATGVYIIYFEVFDMEGNVSKYKEICVVAQKF